MPSLPKGCSELLFRLGEGTVLAGFGLGGLLKHIHPKVRFSLAFTCPWFSGSFRIYPTKLSSLFADPKTFGSPEGCVSNWGAPTNEGLPFVFCFKVSPKRHDPQKRRRKPPGIFQDPWLVAKAPAAFRVTRTSRSFRQAAALCSATPGTLDPGS